MGLTTTGDDSHSLSRLGYGSDIEEETILVNKHALNAIIKGALTNAQWRLADRYSGDLAWLKRLRDASAWCADLATTQWGGSIGGAFGSTLMSVAIRYEGALTIVHCPPLPASFEIAIDDAYARHAHPQAQQTQNQSCGGGRNLREEQGQCGARVTYCA